MSKSCNRCGAEKPLSDYYARDNTCKICRCALVRERRRTNPAVQEYDRRRGNRQSLEDLRRYRAENPVKYAAHSAVGYAVKSGKIVKLDNCEVCSSDFHIEGHHDDYAFPLIVRWLCSKCHSEWHAEHGEAKNSKER